MMYVKLECKDEEDDSINYYHIILDRINHVTYRILLHRLQLRKKPTNKLISKLINLENHKYLIWKCTNELTEKTLLSKYSNNKHQAKIVQTIQIS